MVTTVDNSLLNALHHEFEAFGDRFKAGEAQSVSSNAYGDFCQLNDEIHACEERWPTATARWRRRRWSLHASFMPDFYAPLPDKIYREFTMECSFRTLFMGYHILGKAILAAFWNEDMELFQRDEIRLQRISSCEFFAFFGPDGRAANADINLVAGKNDLDGTAIVGAIHRTRWATSPSLTCCVRGSQRRTPKPA